MGWRFDSESQSGQRL